MDNLILNRIIVIMFMIYLINLNKTQFNVFIFLYYRVIDDVGRLNELNGVDGIDGITKSNGINESN